VKNLFLLLCALTFLPLAIIARPTTGKVVKDSINSDGRKRTYYLFVPDSIQGAAPLLVLLHGSGHNGLSLIEKWKDLANREGIILVGPDAADSSKWNIPADGPDFLHDLVETLKTKYPINPRRVYLFGHSAGAFFALELSLLESEYFAAAAIHAGALPPSTYKLIDHAARKTPLAIWIGTNDQYVPLAAVRATRDALNAKGFSVELKEMPGHDHWYYDLAPKINGEAWEFLKKYELTEEPRYEHYQFKK